MKEIAVLTLCAMMLCDPAMGSGLDAAGEPALAGSMEGMVNPFTECGSLNEAGRRAGFEIQVIKMPEDWGKPSDTCVRGENDRTDLSGCSA